MWSVGCIFAEMLMGKALFPGKDEPDQMDKITRLCGSITDKTTPGCEKWPQCALAAAASAVASCSDGNAAAVHVQIQLLMSGTRAASQVHSACGIELTGRVLLQLPLREAGAPQQAAGALQAGWPE